MLLASSPNPSLYLRKGIVSLIFSLLGPQHRLSLWIREISGMSLSTSSQWVVLHEEVPLCSLAFLQLDEYYSASAQGSQLVRRNDDSRFMQAILLLGGFLLGWKAASSLLVRLLSLSSASDHASLLTSYGRLTFCATRSLIQYKDGKIQNRSGCPGPWQAWCLDTTCVERLPPPPFTEKVEWYILSC